MLFATSFHHFNELHCFLQNRTAKIHLFSSVPHHSKNFFSLFLISFINNTLTPTYTSITTAFPPHFGSFFSKKHTPLSLFLETFRNVFRFPSPKSVLKTEEKNVRIQHPLHIIHTTLPTYRPFSYFCPSFLKINEYEKTIVCFACCCYLVCLQ